MSFAEALSSAPEVIPAALEVAPSNGPEVAVHDNVKDTPRHYEAYYHNGNHEAKEFSDKRLERQRICGLSPKAFWIIIIALVVIVAAAIGGGVGGGLANQVKDTSTSPTSNTPNTITNHPTSTTATQSSSTSSTTTSSLIPAFSSGCNATNRQNFTPLNIVNASKAYEINNTVLTFTIYCYTNFADTGNNPQIHKLQQVIDLTSLEDCITACATYNAALNNVVPGGPMLSDLCTGVVFVQGSPNRCDLDQGTTNNAVDVDFLPGTEIDSAVLQGFGD